MVNVPARLYLDHYGHYEDATEKINIKQHKLHYLGVVGVDAQI